MNGNVTVANPILFRGHSNENILTEEALLYRLGFVNGVQNSPRHYDRIRELLETAHIAVPPLRNCEAVLWRAFLPLHSGMPRFIDLALSNGQPVPPAVLLQYERALHAIAFGSFEVWFSQEHGDNMLLGLDHKRERQYIVAQWNSCRRTPHRTLAEAKDVLREHLSKDSQNTIGFSSARGVRNALAEHDQSCISAIR